MQALEGLRVVDMATVLAGPGAARYLADFGADVIKVEAPDRRRDPGHGLDATRDDGDDLHVEARRPEQAGGRARPQDRRRRSPRCASSPTPPTCSSRTSGRARSSGSGSRPTTCRARNPRLVVLRVTGFGQDGPYAGRPGFATLAEAMSGFAAINGEPDGAPLLPADRAHRRDHRARRRVRGDGRAARTATAPARVRSIDVNLLESMLQVHGPAPDACGRTSGELQPRLGVGHPVLRPPRHLSVRGRRVGRDLDVGRVGRAARARRCSASPATRASRTFERPGRAPRRARRASSPTGSRPGRRPRCWPRSRPRTPRSRPSTRWPTCWPTRTCRRVARSSRSTAWSMPGLVARLVGDAGRGPPPRPPARRRHRRRARRARPSLVAVASSGPAPTGRRSRRLHAPADT